MSWRRLIERYFLVLFAIGQISADNIRIAFEDG